MKIWLRRLLFALIAIFIAAQFFRPSLANLPTDPAKSLTAPANVQPILDRSCMDCHSNSTRWPWYSRISPVSWWLADHVKDGRRELNFSEWNTFTPRRQYRKLEEICEEVKEREMPLKSYLPLHPSAKLSDANRAALCAWAESYRAQVLKTHPEAAKRSR